MKIKFYSKSGTLHATPDKGEKFDSVKATARKIAEVAGNLGFAANCKRVQVGNVMFTVDAEACRVLNEGKRVILKGMHNAVRDCRDVMAYTSVPRRNRIAVAKPRPVKIKQPAPKVGFIPADKAPSMREYKVGKKGTITFRGDYHVITWSRSRRRHEWLLTPEKFYKAEEDVRLGHVNNLGIFCQQFMLAGLKEVH